ncbi:uncharacterized protein LOC123317614 [Coccinella septempunctata]|uniref:uncharacterized protein LOC123317614 n=1 Tax=Coccinella septempunctata TaxID=41139 RepID=UPI001D091745|nr:uncharacterized protein LOC123317614 [Coccinella septempunctata]
MSSRNSTEFVQGSPALPQTRKRQHWTREMNVSLINAYFEVTEGETKTKKYAAKLAERWSEMFPDKQFAGKHLIAQIRNIRSRKLLAPDEIEMIKANTRGDSPNKTAERIRRSIQRRSTAILPEIESNQNRCEQQVPEPEADEASLEIRELFQKINLQWTGVPMEARPKIPKLNLNRNAKTTIQVVDNAMQSEFNSAADFEELCHKVYCAATVTNIIQQTKTPAQDTPHRRKPPWDERIEKKITNLRREIGIIHTYLKNPKPSKKLERKAQAYARRIKTNRKETPNCERLRLHSENLKQKIAALGSRLRRYHKRTQRYRENNLFSNNQRQFFRSLDEEVSNSKTKLPSPADMQKYWSSIWSQKGKHITNATWIEQERKEHNGIQEMPEIVVSEKDVEETVRRMKNWAAPGIDGIQNYWWKAFKHTHKSLASLITEAIKHPHTIPEYFTHGTTIMLSKKGDLTQPRNYRPITCLPAVYKIITSTIGHKIQIHLKKNKIMAWEQNGCKERGRGSKELLVIDNILTKQARRKLKNISMAWIDYQKAYDSIPHSWILEVLEIYKVNKLVIGLIKCLMSTWRTYHDISQQQSE